MTNTTLGPYRILSQLGKGGMGEVWLAEDTRLDRKVAVKVLPADLAADADRRRRFEQEARAAAALNHPNIAEASTVYTVEVRTTPNFSAGEARLTFDIGRLGVGNVMDASADGEQLLVAFADSEGSRDSRPRVHVVLNWTDRIEARLASDGAAR